LPCFQYSDQQKEKKKERKGREGEEFFLYRREGQRKKLTDQEVLQIREVIYLLFIGGEKKRGEIKKKRGRGKREISEEKGGDHFTESVELWIGS